MNPRHILGPLLFGAVLAGCTTARESHPERTATEQLLISTAADRAAERLDFGVPKGTRVFMEAANFEGVDAKYAIAAIRERALAQGLGLTDDKEEAAAIIEIRAAALSVDQEDFLIGVPHFDVPIPLAGGEFGIPEIPFYKNDLRQGIAKFSAASYDAKDGRLIAVSKPPAQSAYQKETILLLFITWSEDNLPKPEQ